MQQWYVKTIKYISMYCGKIWVVTARGYIPGHKLAEALVTYRSSILVEEEPRTTSHRNITTLARFSQASRLLLPIRGGTEHANHTFWRAALP